MDLILQSKKWGGSTDLKKPIYIKPTRESLQMKAHTHTENEGVRKDILHKREQKETELAKLISYKVDFVDFKNKIFSYFSSKNGFIQE